MLEHPESEATAPSPRTHPAVNWRVPILGILGTSFFARGLLIPWLGFYWDDLPTLWAMHAYGPGRHLAVLPLGSSVPSVDLPADSPPRRRVAGSLAASRTAGVVPCGGLCLVADDGPLAVSAKARTAECAVVCCVPGLPAGPDLDHLFPLPVPLRPVLLLLQLYRSRDQGRTQVPSMVRGCVGHPGPGFVLLRVFGRP